MYWPFFRIYLVLGVTTFSVTRYRSFDIPFQWNKVHLVLAKGLYFQHIRISLQFKLFLYLSWECYPIQGIPCIRLCLFTNTRWENFAIQGCPCFEFWLYSVTSQYNVMISNTRWKYFPIQGCPCIGFWRYYVLSQYKVTIFCNSRLTLYWSIVLVKFTYDNI